MKTEPEITPQHAPMPNLSREICLGCPLHLAMERIAQIAVKQHVLYLEGESQPRPELLHLLDSWSSLHTLIHSRVCVASRTATISPDELKSTLDTLAPIALDSIVPLQRRKFLASLETCARATMCPLGADDLTQSVQPLPAPETLGK